MGRGLECGIRPRSNAAPTSRKGLTKPSGTEFKPVPNHTSSKSIGGEPLLGERRSTPQQPASGPVNVNIPAYPNLVPRARTVAAVAKNNGINVGLGSNLVGTGTFGAWKANDGGTEGQISGGASILDDLMRQGLISDQYDRTVQEQDDILRSKAESRRKAAATNTDKRD
eukprot:CAMPEP_0171295610 /NCGR_PEP_ID=MMETSP0816-20121228/4230_1 /TAXON_ID=420281 /ORGANISM="Proboscia inermis, Strain CCAP1064/1" /LENGTH=168 /DNA_ID=CAMNT_0011768415 /DNA_START=548 /DNA_END=1056 /DNA_ORIENTATION=-